jgi:hypothetical protein
LQEAVGKIEDVLDMQLQAETGIGLSEVYISEQDRYRIFQAPEGKRNWASSPAPVIKKNGAVISSGFTIDYGGGAVIFSTPLSGTDTVTADFSRTKTDGNKLAMLDAADVPYDNTESELTATDTQAAIDETVDMVKTHKAKTASINAIGHVYAAEFTATLSTSWSGSAAPYTQTVTINGITSAHNPIIDVVMSGTYSTDQQRIEQWGYIYRAVTGTNQITFYASEKPTVSLPIRVKVVR